MQIVGAHIEIDGMKEVLDSFQRYGVATRDMTKAFRPISNMLARQARKEAPRREGYLKKSIRPYTRKDRAAARAGGRSAFYTPVVHFGWHRHNITPNHFMLRALEAKAPEAERKMVEALRKLAREQGLQITS